MEWWNTVIWSWGNNELTNGKLVIIIPLLVLLVLCFIMLIKCVFVAPHTKEFLIYHRYIGVLDKAFQEGRIDKECWQILRFSLNDLLIPFGLWVWCPWKWTTKQMFRKGRYNHLLMLTSLLQDL